MMDGCTKLKSCTTSKTNPFLTDKADALWEGLDKNGKTVFKEDLLKRIKDIKNKADESRR